MSNGKAIGGFKPNDIPPELHHGNEIKNFSFYFNRANIVFDFDKKIRNANPVFLLVDRKTCPWNQFVKMPTKNVMPIELTILWFSPRIFPHKH